LGMDFVGLGFCKGHEDVHTVHYESVCFASRCLADGVDDVATEGEKGRCR
jgi:hypothetical protein